MTESERIVRIMQMEQYFDVLLQTDPRDIPENPELEEILSLLTDYCESGRWLADYEADERGELPKNLKRGVLSQDGLYNLLHHIDLQIKRRNTMNVDISALKMLQELADAPGAPGFEDEVVAVARRWAAPIGELKEDFLRNLYIHRKENTGDKPVIMLDAHSDEVGLIVQAIKPNGTLRFLPLGSWNKNALIGTKVLVRNALGEYIPGIIAAKPVHYMSAAEKANPTLDISDMVIDVGAISYEDAVENFHLRMGEPVVPATKFFYDEKRDLIFGKGFDCRIGCAALLEALRRLEGEELPCDVIAVLSTQEELGPRNSKVTVHHINPDIAIVMEGCPADDTFAEGYMIQTALKKGPMFRHMDISAICAPRYQRWALDLAAKEGIPVQEAVRQGGGNNAASIQTALVGAPAIVCGVPVRYAHATNCISSYYDYEMAVQMVMALLRNITADVIAGM